MASNLSGVEFLLKTYYGTVNLGVEFVNFLFKIDTRASLKLSSLG
jgi:hypothetical protein